ncbi:MAG: aminopeptidase [Patescibacteria group bacterium]
MAITQILSRSDCIRSLSSQEQIVGEVVFRKSFQVANNERVLIVSDPRKTNEAAIFFESAKLYTSQLEYISFDGMTENSQEPPDEVAAKMRNAQIVLLVTSFSLSHTQARREACQNGVRIASLPGISHSMILRTLQTDPHALKKQTETIATLLSKNSHVRITSPEGTELTISIKGRKGIADTGILHMPGSFGNLPAGEAFIAPVEGSAEGILVVDGAMAGIDLDTPTMIKIANGNVTMITESQAGKELLRRMDTAGPKSRVVCELGIGTNPTTLLNHNVLEAEKVYGTCHIAFGNNSTFGGTNSVLFHTDVVLRNPMVMIEDKIVVKEGSIRV